MGTTTPTVAVVTDSVTGIPKTYQEELGIHVAPNILIWSGKEYRDGVDILPEAFYSRLVNTDELPTTAAVPPITFQNLFSKLLEEGYAVLGIFTSSKMSAIYANACQAKDKFPQDTQKKIELIDSQTFAMWAGWAVIRTARAAREGKSLPQCGAIARESLAYSGGYVMVDTLKYIQRSGRISNAQRLFGTLLNMKPVLGVVDGELVSIDRVRTRSSAFRRIITLAQEQIKGSAAVQLAVMHANAEARANELLEMTSKVITLSETIITSIGPNLGTHSGPGAVGICYCYHAGEAA